MPIDGWRQPRSLRNSVVRTALIARRCFGLAMPLGLGSPGVFNFGVGSIRLGFPGVAAKLVLVRRVGQLVRARPVKLVSCAKAVLAKCVAGEAPAGL